MKLSKSSYFQVMKFLLLIMHIFGCDEVDIVHKFANFASAISFDYSIDNSEDCLSHYPRVSGASKQVSMMAATYPDMFVRQVNNCCLSGRSLMEAVSHIQWPAELLKKMEAQLMCVLS